MLKYVILARQLLAVPIAICCVTYQSVNQNGLNVQENAFVLALDGDVDFEPEAVELVLDRMRRNKNVGACCNQIHPQVRI